MQFKIVSVFLFGIVLSLNSFAGYSEKAVCKKTNKTIWQKNWAGCARSFKNAIDSKDVDANWMNSVCDCIADELINNLSCEDLKHLDEDQKFEKYKDEKISSICIKRFPIKKK